MRRFAIVLIAAAATGLVAAQDPPAAGDEVRVYTNADLEALPPLPVMQRAMPPATDDDWAFVQAFIASQRAKLADERDRDLERERLELERERTLPEPRYSVPLGFLPFGPYACNGIGSLFCRPNVPVGHPEPPTGGDGPRPEPPRVEPRPGRPLPRSVPATARVGARSDG